MIMQPKFTICFGLDGDRILLLKRIKRPYPGRWTGLGGKIEPGEAHDLAARREMGEESGYKDLPANSFVYRGVARWQVAEETGLRIDGMHVYIADLAGLAKDEPWETREGLVAWQPVSWAAVPSNPEIAPHVAAMLPALLQAKEPQIYDMRFTDRDFIGMEVLAWDCRSSLNILA